MTKVLNDLLTAVDDGKPSIILSLNISAAFDMLVHTRLLKRATEVFGPTDQVINGLKSYLTDLPTTSPSETVILPLLIVLQECRKPFLDLCFSILLQQQSVGQRL